jgi:hypothetical protein
MMTLMPKLPEIRRSKEVNVIALREFPGNPDLATG